MGLQCIEEGPEERRGGRVELCGEEMSPLELQFSAARLRLQCVCSPEQMLETGMANASRCAGASLGNSFGPAMVRDGGVLVSQSSGAWATVQGGFEGMSWQNPVKLEHQHQEEVAAWPTGWCFGLLDLLESLIFWKV